MRVDEPRQLRDLLAPTDEAGQLDRRLAGRGAPRRGLFVDGTTLPTSRQPDRRAESPTWAMYPAGCAGSVDVMTASAAAIDVRGLTKSYGDRKVVDGLDLTDPTGTVAGLIGPNGAGKTTTMAMLLGLVRPTAGAGSVLGSPISGPQGDLPGVGALIEGPAFYPSLSGTRNLELFAAAAGLPRAGIAELLELAGLGDRGEDRYRSHSLRTRQRLGVAAALLGSAALLVLDEPANGLDPHEVLASLTQGGSAELGLAQATLTALAYAAVAAGVSMLLLHRRDVTA
jgi:ABC-type transporter Mla maintaining outer membrane lipid asymmetry ATPase subunit MlaF